MSNLEIILTAVTSILTIVCSSGSIFYIKEIKKNKQIVNKTCELDAIERALTIMETRFVQSDLDSVDKQKKINSLLDIIHEKDTIIGDKNKEINNLQLENEELNWYKCEVHHCEKRVPPRKI